MEYNDKASSHFTAAAQALESTTKQLNRLILGEERNTIMDMDAISRFLAQLGASLQRLEACQDESQVIEGLVKAHREIGEILVVLQTSVHP